MSRRDVGAVGVAAFVWIAAFGLASSLTGCGSDPAPATAASAAGKAKPGAGGRADMVAAVSSTRNIGAVDVRFALSGRPVVGQPVDIRLSFRPGIELDRLFARFQASDGLDLVKGAETGQLDRPAIGADIQHIVTVVPKSDGIFYVTAVVLTDSPTESVTRNYSIPIIAGAGLAELPQPEMARPPSRPSRP
jgi:hypothetical protein